MQKFSLGVAKRTAAAAKSEETLNDSNKIIETKICKSEAHESNDQSPTLVNGLKVPGRSTESTVSRESEIESPDFKVSNRLILSRMSN